jgi:hypothetical protein
MAAADPTHPTEEKDQKEKPKDTKVSSAQG